MLYSKIGITGTRSGMNEYQKDILAKFLESQWQAGSLFHHGDCVGVDIESAIIAWSLGYIIVTHPPEKDELRAFYKSGRFIDEERKPLSYFARNRNIVDETDLLIVVPWQAEWQPKGGTWYTHDYAKKKKKPRLIIYPDRVEFVKETK